MIKTFVSFSVQVAMLTIDKGPPQPDGQAYLTTSPLSCPSSGQILLKYGSSSL